MPSQRPSPIILTPNGREPCTHALRAQPRTSRHAALQRGAGALLTSRQAVHHRPRGRSLHPVKAGRGCDKVASAMLPCIANRADVDFTYSLTDRIFRLSLGELADFSGAKYDGEFALSLDEAQRRKHEYV